MNDTENNAANVKRYNAAAHAMQSGVAYEQARNPDPTEPKHLRVGVNTALTDHATLARLLMKKGVFSEAEYLAELADGMEEEAKRYEKHLSEMFGAEVTLK